MQKGQELSMTDILQKTTEKSKSQNAKLLMLLVDVSPPSLVHCVDLAHTQIIATIVTIISEHISNTKSSKYADTYFFCTGALYK
jgi:hypothetical protein